MVWEEAQQVSGKNPDFIRQDLFESIENGYYPEWEVCLLSSPCKTEPVLTYLFSV